MSPDRRRTSRVIIYRAEIEGSTPPEVWEVEYEAVADALHFACRDLREGRRRPLTIMEDGMEVLDAAGIEEACRERDEQRNSTLGNGE